MCWLYSGKQHVYLSIGRMDQETHAFIRDPPADLEAQVSKLSLAEAATSHHEDKAIISAFVKERIRGGFKTASDCVRDALRGKGSDADQFRQLLDEFDAASMTKGRVNYAAARHGGFNGWGAGNGVHEPEVDKGAVAPAAAPAAAAPPVVPRRPSVTFATAPSVQPGTRGASVLGGVKAGSCRRGLSPAGGGAGPGSGAR